MNSSEVESLHDSIVDLYITLKLRPTDEVSISCPFFLLQFIYMSSIVGRDL